MKESECCSKVIETKFDKSLVMTKKDYGDFKNSSKCWICKKVYEESEVTVNYHNHINGIYQGSAHQEYYSQMHCTGKCSQQTSII